MIILMLSLLLFLQVSEIGLLLGLMCKYSCEESELHVYTPEGSSEVELEKGTILDNMASVQDLNPSHSTMVCFFGV